jgi:hypothetical protein
LIFAIYKFVIIYYIIKLSDNAFTYGNLILLYCNFNKAGLTDSEIGYEAANNTVHESLPDFIIGRIALCIQTFNIIMKSKPDKFNTSIILISKNEYTQVITDRLIAGGISKQYIENDNNSRTIESVINNVLFKISNLTNPPTIYFIGSVWQKEVFDSIVVSKLKKFKVHFEGALDHRPYDVIQKDKLTEEPKKGSNYYKHKLTNKAIDTLLNYIFSNKRK